MDSTILATRKAQAINRITELSKRFAQAADLDPALVDALQPGVKDPQVKELRRFEAIADLMSALALSAHLVKEPEPALTEPVATAAEPSAALPLDGLPAPEIDPAVATVTGDLAQPIDPDAAASEEAQPVETEETVSEIQTAELIEAEPEAEAKSIEKKTKGRATRKG